MKWGVRKAWYARLLKNINSEVNLRCNMCKFCNNKAKSIILNVERDGIMDEKVQAFQATIKGNELMFEIISNHLSTYFNLTTLKKRILYCPICGRKLVQ